MRPILLLTINFALLDVAIPVAAQQSGDFAYSSDGTSITVTRYLGNGGFVTIPGTIDGLPVTNIGEGAFRFCPFIAQLTLPDNISKIGDRAFEFAGLLSMAIPDTVTNIGDWAFDTCELSLPEGLSGRISVYERFASERNRRPLKVPWPAVQTRAGCGPLAFPNRPRLRLSSSRPGPLPYNPAMLSKEDFEHAIT